jgi:transcriptional regulator with XRE-family HTH domain
MAEQDHNSEPPGGGISIAEYVRARRVNRGWTQELLARRADVSVDSVRRAESAGYRLPARPQSESNVLERLAEVFGEEICDVVRECFPESEIRASIYRRCLDPPTHQEPSTPNDDVSERGSLADFVAALPRNRRALIRQAGMLNAHAIAFLIALEQQFSAFEFLVTNQPPFMLFADEEYITTGSASTELPERDRATYHQLIFDHRARVRDAVKTGQKHYKVVLHQQSLIQFLNARSADRAAAIIEDMLSFLGYDGLDLVILDDPHPPEEFEVLSDSYPPAFTDDDAISIRHRRVGVENTLVYQLALIGLNPVLVREDLAQAESFYSRAASHSTQFDDRYADFRQGRYQLRLKRVTAHLLSDALLAAHPEP